MKTKIIVKNFKWYFIEDTKKHQKKRKKNFWLKKAIIYFLSR